MSGINEQELRTIFNMMDLNGDQELTTPEVVSWNGDLFIQIVDRDNDADVDFSEFKKFVDTYPRASSVADTLFTSGVSTVNKQSVKNFLVNKYSDEQVDVGFAVADKYGTQYVEGVKVKEADGLLNYGEGTDLFVTLIYKYGDKL